MNQTIYRVSGADRQTFLQGQLTQDIALLGPTRALFAGYCDPKGRLLTTVILAARESEWLMLLPTDHHASIVKRLQMFVLRADVQFELATDWHCAVVPNASSLSPWTSAVDGNAITIAVGSDCGLRICQQLPADALPGDHAEAALIRCLLPEVSANTSGELIPQSINLDLLDGVSFSKGCYTGQEIVARLHYRGTPARRLYSLQKPSGLQLDRGEKLVDEHGTAVGIVIRDSAESPRLLASLKTSAATPGTSLRGAHGVQLTVSEGSTSPAS